MCLSLGAILPTLILLNDLQTLRGKSALFSRDKVVEKAVLRRGQWNAPQRNYGATRVFICFVLFSEAGAKVSQAGLRLTV